MRILSSLIFVFLYGIALLRPIYPLLDYYARYEIYAKELCTNLNFPELKCEGKCILMQRLQEAYEQENPKPEMPSSGNSINLKDYPIGFVVLWNHQPGQISTIPSAFTNRVLFSRQSVHSEIFKPPV